MVEMTPVAFPTEVALGMFRGETQAWLARPRAVTEVPGLVIVHDAPGLNEPVLNMTRRAAAAGYMTIAPDMFSRAGGTDAFPDPEARREAAAAVDLWDMVSDVRGAASHLRATGALNGRVGVLGLGWGAGLALRLATEANVHACVIVDGLTADPALLGRLRAPLLALLASEEADPAAELAFEEALDRADRSYEIRRYEGVGPEFHGAASPARYDPVAAGDAWERTLAHFERHLMS
jgi:carboxymethylenebutenolidase